MREILFKAKRVDNGEWVEGDLSRLDTPRKTAYFINSIEVIPETICQYTGLTDKNGNKIWEGDILKGGIYLKYEVKWDYEDCGWNIPESAINFKVIGHIHDKQPTL